MTHWDYSVYGEPDVVFMKYEGGTRNAIDIRKNYEAMRLQREVARKRRGIKHTDTLDEGISQRGRRGLDKESSASDKRSVGAHNRTGALESQKEIAPEP